MGRLADDMKAEIEALERGELTVTESPIGDRGEPRPPANIPNGRILLRISRGEHERLVQEAFEQGVSLNHYLTEIVCSRQKTQNVARKTRGTRPYRQTSSKKLVGQR
jgi:predicted HicB family RNase H-like nuclease